MTVGEQPQELGPAEAARAPLIRRRPGLAPPRTAPEPAARLIGLRIAPETVSTDPRKNPLLRFLAINAALGVALGQVMLWLMLWLDLAGLGETVFASSAPTFVIIILSVKFGLTFAAGVVATAVMTLPYARDGRR